MNYNLYLKCAGKLIYTWWLLLRFFSIIKRMHKYVIVKHWGNIAKYKRNKIGVPIVAQQK